MISIAPIIAQDYQLLAPSYAVQNTTFPSMPNAFCSTSKPHSNEQRCFTTESEFKTDALIGFFAELKREQWLYAENQKKLEENYVYEKERKQHLSNLILTIQNDQATSAEPIHKTAVCQMEGESIATYISRIYRTVSGQDYDLTKLTDPGDSFQGSWNTLPWRSQRYVIALLVSLKVHNPNDCLSTSHLTPFDLSYSHLTPLGLAFNKKDYELMICLMNKGAFATHMLGHDLFGVLSHMIRNSDEKTIEILQQIDLASYQPPQAELDEFGGILMEMFVDLKETAHLQTPELVTAKASYIMSLVELQVPHLRRTFIFTSHIRPADISTPGAQALYDYFKKLRQGECFLL